MAGIIAKIINFFNPKIIKEVKICDKMRNIIGESYKNKVKKSNFEHIEWMFFNEIYIPLHLMYRKVENKIFNDNK